MNRSLREMLIEMIFACTSVCRDCFTAKARDLRHSFYHVSWNGFRRHSV